MTRFRSATMYAVLAMFAVHASGCATMFTDSNEDVSFTSDPEGAEVEIDGESRGKTPTTVELDAENTYEVTIRKEGYEPQTAKLDNQVGVLWVVLDLAAFGLPVAIDALTGAWWEFEEGSVSVTLQEKEGAEKKPVAEQEVPEEKRPDEDLSAKELFKRGAGHYDAGEYEKALIDFKAAHRRQPDPVLLYNVAFSYSKLGEYRKALETAAQIEDPAELPKKVRTKLGALEASNHVIVKSRDLTAPDS